MDARGRTLISFPYWRDNPYLNMLYLATRAAGETLKTTSDFDTALTLIGSATSGDVFHLHWTAPIVQRATTVDEARARLERFRAAITAGQKRGVQLVWTIHNKLPHEVSFLKEELELISFLLERAVAIHTLSPGTETAVSDLYRVPPEKIMNVPHASFLGVYDQSITRAEAREFWSLNEDDKVILFFGQMRPYKGLDGLFRAVQSASERSKGNLVLLLAGKTFDDELPRLEAMLPQGVRIIRQHSYISDEELPRWFTAADLAVFPYENVLNSSSVHLAATFGLPSALPNHPHVVEEFAAEGWMQFFDRNDIVESLARLILDFDDRSGTLRASAEKFAYSYTPYDMSRTFYEKLNAVTRGASVPTGA